MSLLVGPACIDYLARHAGARQEDLAALLGVSQSTVNRWINGGEASESTALAVLDKLGWRLDRARPDYDPIREALSAAKKLREHVVAARSAAPLLVDGKPAKRPRAPVRVHDDAPPEQSTLDELWSAVEELRALANDTRAKVLAPAADAPRAALIQRNGEVILDPAAPVNAKRQAITSAAGLAEAAQLAVPAKWKATRGPVIIATPDAGSDSPAIHVFREPVDPSPRVGLHCIVPGPDGKLYLRTIMEGGDGRMFAAPVGAKQLPGFDFDPKATAVVAVRLLGVGE